MFPIELASRITAMSRMVMVGAYEKWHVRQGLSRLFAGASRLTP